MCASFHVDSKLSYFILFPLPDVNEKIRQYERSNKEGEIEEVDQALRQNARDIRGREERLVAMKPEIDNLKKQVEDG